MRKPTWISIIALLLLAALGTPSSALAGGPDIPPDFFELVAADGAASDRFGVSVAIDGDTALVGASNASVGGVSNRGAAYVFVRDGDQWVQQARLNEPDGLASRFGASVALSGDTALIGTGDSGTNKAYVFTRTGSEWTQQGELSGADSAPGDSYGIPVALDGDTAVVGAHTIDIDGTFNQGAVYVFTRDGSTWNEEARLTASDGAGFSLFARSLALAGDTIAVGAPFHDLDGNTNQGAGYVFVRDNGEWIEQAQLIASDGVAADTLGEAVAVSATRVVIGAPPAAAAYVFDLVDDEWTEQAILTPSDGASGNFGDAVALSGDRIVVGALFADSNQGAAYVFELEDGDWVEREKHSPPGSAGGQLGNAVAMAGDTVLAGAHATNVDGNDNQGAAYVITPGEPSPALELDQLVLDFGNIEVGTTSPTMLSMLINAGNVEITGLEFTEPGGDFNADTNVCGTALVVGQSCPILVTFEPGQPGPATATIEITSAETEPLQLELVANGVDGAFPEADIAPEAFNFEVESGDDDSATLTIGNTGTDELSWEIDQVAGVGDCASPGDLPWLEVVPDEGTTPPGDSAAVAVSVDAADLVPSEYSALLCVTTNDPDAALVEIPVTLTVIEPVLVEMTFTPSSLDFGDVELGTVSASMTAVLENTGDVELTGLNFGHSGAGFEADGNRCGDTLPVGGSCNVNVAFTPTVAGPADAVLEVTSSQAAGADLELSGTGIVPARPAIGVDPDTLSVTLTQGDAGALPLTIANSGDAVLDWQFAEERTAMRRVGAIGVQAHENLDWAAVIDPAGEFAYFSANTDEFARGGVVKIDLDTFERVDALTFAEDERLPRAAVIDPAGEFAYFGTGSGHIVRVDLETFERVDRVSLGAGETALVSAVIDPAGEFAYFATNLMPGRVVKVDLENFERVGSVILSSGEWRLHAAAIDPSGEFAYFGTDGGHVVKIRLDPFEEVDEIVLPGSEIALTSAVIDPSGEFAYFGTSIEPRVVRIDLETFTRVDSLTLPVGAQQILSAVIDPAGEFAYFSTLGHDQIQQDPAWLAKIDLATFEMVDAVDMADGEHGLRSAVIDPAGAFAYFATSVDGASRVVKTALREDCMLPAWASVEVAGGTVDPDGNQAVDVTFDAAGLEPGEYQAGLCIASNDPASPLTRVTVTLAVEAPPGVLAAEPGMHDFGAVEIGQSPSLEIIVSNVADAGADPLTLESIGLGGDGAFELTGGDCAQGTLLAAQQGCTVTVSFSPLAEQPYTGQVEVTSGDGQAVTVDLSGAGVERPDLPDEVFSDRFEPDL